MSRLELRNLIFHPSVKSNATVLVPFYASGRIASDHADIDGIVQHHPQQLDQVVGRFGRLSLVGHDVHDVFAPQPLERLVAVFSAKLVDNSEATRRISAPWACTGQFRIDRSLNSVTPTVQFQPNTVRIVPVCSACECLEATDG